MISFKRLTALLMALLMCLSLAACSSSDDPEVGNDWRTTGIVVGSGTITHDGDSVDVLVTISSESAAFYRDEAEQILFDSVSFPVAIPDAKDAFTSISFDDLSADGESDVYIRFEHENGDSTELVWIWDPDERYVFSEDLSSVPAAHTLKIMISMLTPLSTTAAICWREAFAATQTLATATPSVTATGRSK